MQELFRLASKHKTELYLMKKKIFFVTALVVLMISFYYYKALIEQTIFFAIALIVIISVMIFFYYSKTQEPIINSNEDVNIVFAVDKNYYKHLPTVITSILYNCHSLVSVNFFIITNEQEGSLDEQELTNLSKLHSSSYSFIYTNKDLTKSFDNIKTHSYVTAITNVRLLMPDILLNIDKVIYLDADLLVRDDISKLYNIDISDYMIAMSSDRSMWVAIRDIVFRRGHTFRLFGVYDIYYNAGVILMNLKKMRDNNYKEILEVALQDKYIKKYTLADQDILNVAYRNKILTLDKKWNDSPRKTTGKILHFRGGNKPWGNQNLEWERYRKISLQNK